MADNLADPNYAGSAPSPWSKYYAATMHADDAWSASVAAAYQALEVATSGADAGLNDDQTPSGGGEIAAAAALRDFIVNETESDYEEEVANIDSQFQAAMAAATIQTPVSFPALEAAHPSANYVGSASAKIDPTIAFASACSSTSSCNPMQRANGIVDDLVAREFSDGIDEPSTDDGAENGWTHSLVRADDGSEADTAIGGDGEQDSQDTGDSDRAATASLMVQTLIGALSPQFKSLLITGALVDKSLPLPRTKILPSDINPAAKFEFVATGGASAGHHIFPRSLFNRVKGLSDDVKDFFENAVEARIANEFFKSHEGGYYNGVAHPEYSRLVNDEWSKFVKQLKESGKISSVSDITSNHAADFIKQLQFGGGKIGQFLAGVKFEADWAKRIADVLDEKASQRWQDYARQASNLDGKNAGLLEKLSDIRKRIAAVGGNDHLIERKRGLEREIKSNTDAIKKLESKMLDIMKKWSVAFKGLGEQAAGKIIKKLGGELAEAASEKAGTTLAGRLGSALTSKAAKKIFAVGVPFIGTMYMLSQGDVEGAVIDGIEDAVAPGVWILDLELYFLIGPDEYERVKKMSFNERAAEYGKAVKALQRAADTNQLPVDAVPLPGGGYVYPGQEVWPTDKPGEKTMIVGIEKLENGSVKIYMKNNTELVIDSIAIDSSQENGQ